MLLRKKNQQQQKNHKKPQVMAEWKKGVCLLRTSAFGRGELVLQKSVPSMDPHERDAD